MGRRHGEMGRRRGGLGEMEHKPKTNPEQSDGGLGEMGLSDKGERKKMRMKKEERKEVGDREKEKKYKIFF